MGVVVPAILWGKPIACIPLQSSFWYGYPRTLWGFIHVTKITIDSKHGEYPRILWVKYPCQPYTVTKPWSSHDTTTCKNKRGRSEVRMRLSDLMRKWWRTDVLKSESCFHFIGVQLTPELMQDDTQEWFGCILLLLWGLSDNFGF